MTAPSIKEALELKPCPFCGGDAESDSQRHYRNISTGNLEKSAAIYCTKCNADMAWCYRDTPEIEREQVMLLLTEQWNSRATLSQPTTDRREIVARFETRKHITRQMLRDEPDTLFVFGDNMVERGFGGQAKEMRGEPNAVGIPTKLLPERGPSAYFRDEDLSRARPKIDAAFLRLAFHALHGGKIVWPAAGIGTGLAELETRAPAIWQVIESGRAILSALDGGR